MKPTKYQGRHNIGSTAVNVYFFVVVECRVTLQDPLGLLELIVY